jgi:hypothetical protein
MSALNVTQEEADLLMVSLKMYADVHQNASGVVPEDVAVLLAKLAPAPAPVVVEEAPVVVEEEKPAKAKKAKVEEASAEEAPTAE